MVLPLPSVLSMSKNPILPKSMTQNRALVDVRALFNAKASTWNAKYRSDGPLAFRIAAFRRILLTRFPVNSRVLDLGCGTGAIASALSADGFRVTACDIAEEMVEAGKRIHAGSSVEWCVLPPDWKKLPFESGRFDAIIASSVLEYLPDVDGVLAECRRTLRARGSLIATVPNIRTLTRKLEGVARPVAVLLNGFAGVRSFRRLHSYTSYLKYSCNRMSPQAWRAVGTRVHFDAVDAIKGDGWNGSLVFLIFEKATETRQ
jgi:2-polyprenyl-3-methyl-5-hydroxy-6-metoxy-1,4-benzoquinol methylase